MTEATTPASPHITPYGPPSTGPLLAWLLIQLAALTVATLGVPLAAKYPRPGESLAAHVMVVAQVVGAGLLFPYLMRDWRTAATAIAAAWPFLLIAAGIATVPAADAARAGGCVTLWLVALALWRAALPGRRSQALATAVAGLLTIGAAGVAYLRWEFVGAGVVPVRMMWLLPAGLCVTAIPVLLARQILGQKPRRRIPTDPSVPSR